MFDLLSGLFGVCFDTPRDGGSGGGGGQDVDPDDDDELDDEDEEEGDEEEGDEEGKKGGKNAPAPKITLTKPMRVALRKMGVDPDKATPQQAVDALFKSRGDVLKESAKHKAAAQTLEALDLGSLLADKDGKPIEVTAGAREKLQQVVNYRSNMSTIIDQLEEQEIIGEGLAELLREGDVKALGILIKAGVLDQSAGKDDDDDEDDDKSFDKRVAKGVKAVLAELGIGDDLPTGGGKTGGSGGKNSKSDKKGKLAEYGMSTTRPSRSRFIEGFNPKPAEAGTKK